jgi:hypothetical protein
MPQIALSADEHSLLVKLAAGADRLVKPGRLVGSQELPLEVRNPIFEAYERIARAHRLDARDCRFQSYAELGKSFILTGDQQIPNVT